MSGYFSSTNVCKVLLSSLDPPPPIFPKNCSRIVLHNEKITTQEKSNGTRKLKVFIIIKKNVLFKGKYQKKYSIYF